MQSCVLLRSFFSVVHACVFFIRSKIFFFGGVYWWRWVGWSWRFGCYLCWVAMNFKLHYTQFRQVCSQGGIFWDFRCFGVFFSNFLGFLEKNPKIPFYKFLATLLPRGTLRYRLGVPKINIFYIFIYDF